MRTTGFCPLIQVTKLDAQNGALDGIHPVVVAFQRMVIAPALSPIAQHAQCVRLIVVVRHSHAAFAAGSKILAGIEAEASGQPHAACLGTEILGAMRLASIFDHDQPMRIRNVHDRIHVCHLSVKMDGYDRFRSLRDRLFDLGGIHRQCVAIDIHENRPGAGVANGGHGRDEGERDGDHFVAWSDAGSEQRKV